MTDVTKCIGCWKCVEACSETYNLGPAIPTQTDMGDGLSDTCWTTIIERSGQNFVRKFCLHCNDPACVSACIVGALQKTPEGPVIYDEKKCIGCRYCMMACPYGIPRYEWQKPVPFIKKCIFCYPRLKEGQQPACVEACPTQATIFGKRSDLLKEAWQRIKAHPDRYIQHVYGEKEVGGTSMLFIAGIPLDFLGWKPDVGEKNIPKLTWAALNKVPWIASGMGAAMLGLWWIIERRTRLAEQKIEEEGKAQSEGNQS